MDFEAPDFGKLGLQSLGNLSHEYGLRTEKEPQVQNGELWLGMSSPSLKMDTYACRTETILKGSHLPRTGIKNTVMRRIARRNECKSVPK